MLVRVPVGATETLGLELAGEVIELGEYCEGFKVGDRVMALVAGGGNAEFAIAYFQLTMHVPDSMSMNTAASIPEVWLTAFQILHFVGHMKKGDSVLVHAGGSGVGLAAVQLAKYAGAKSIYVTAGTQAKIDKAVELGATAGFNYKTENFADEIEQAEPNGVNLILDCVGGSHSALNARAVALDGRWVLYGLMGGVEPPVALLRDIVRKRVALTGTTLRTRSLEYKAELVEDFQKHAGHYGLFEYIAAVVDRTFGSLEETQEAHEYMEANKNIGKIVITVRPDESAKEQAGGEL